MQKRIFTPLTIRRFFEFMLWDLPISDIQFLTEECVLFDYEDGSYRMSVIDFAPGGDMHIRLEKLICGNSVAEPYYRTVSDRICSVEEIEQFIEDYNFVESAYAAETERKEKIAEEEAKPEDIDDYDDDEFDFLYTDEDLEPDFSEVFYDDEIEDEVEEGVEEVIEPIEDEDVKDVINLITEEAQEDEYEDYDITSDISSNDSDYGFEDYKIHMSPEMLAFAIG